MGCILVCSSPWVNVLDSGYKWNGEVYPTLTHISWKAAGYQIGGNNFFGLPTKRRGSKACPLLPMGLFFKGRQWESKVFLRYK